MSAKKMGGPKLLYYLVFVFLPMGALGYYGIYLWYFHDYGIQPPPSRDPLNRQDPRIADEPPGVLEASVRLPFDKVDAARAHAEHRALQAELVLRNKGGRGVRALYSPWPSKLLKVRLFFLGAAGAGGKPEELRPVKPPEAERRTPNLVRHFINQVDAGEELSVPIALMPPYDLTRPGHYRLQVSYEPLAYVRAYGLNASSLALDTMALQADAVEFEVFAEPEKPEAQKAGPPDAERTGDK